MVQHYGRGHDNLDGRGGGIHITQLKTLRPLWEKFDDSVQDDASHFLSELNELSATDQTMVHYYQVDHRQRVHQRKAFPVHLVCPETQGPQEFEELINTWANTAEVKF